MVERAARRSATEGYSRDRAKTGGLAPLLVCKATESRPSISRRICKQGGTARKTVLVPEGMRAFFYFYPRDVIGESSFLFFGGDCHEKTDRKSDSQDVS